MGIDGFITPNLIERAKNVFQLYPEYRLDMERAAKENPFLVLRYRSILSSIANAQISNNVARFDKAIAAYICIYKKFKQLRLYHDE